jgi:hypothetical protein
MKADEDALQDGGRWEPSHPRQRGWRGRGCGWPAGSADKEMRPGTKGVNGGMAEMRRPDDREHEWI